MKIHVVFPWCPTVRFSSKILSHLTVTHYHVTFTKLQHYKDSQEMQRAYLLIFVFYFLSLYRLQWLFSRQQSGKREERVDQYLKIILLTTLERVWNLIKPIKIDSVIY